MKTRMRTIVLMLGGVMSLFSNPAMGASPKIQIYDEVQKGFEVGLQGGIAYDFKPAVKKPGLGLLTGLELGYDITWVFRIKGGYNAIYYNGSGKDRKGHITSLDYEGHTFWAGASLALLATQRLFLYVQAGVGYLMATPQKVDTILVSGKNDIAILVGGGVEYYPPFRHFSFALETNVTILPSRGDAVIAVFPMVRYTFGVGGVKTIQPEKDRDHDGVPDSEDACPDVWGSPANKGCPEPDTDGDGVIDREDNCPNDPGPASNRGCPLVVDTDNDGIPDNVDQCPKEPGPKSNNGCPEKDTDEDGVPDSIDKCPKLKGKPEFDGCPSKGQIKVIVKQNTFELREKVHFETNRDIIKKESFPLLDQVVAALKEHTEVTKLQIEGHTDSVGPAAYNLDLSQRRAQAVVKYLINHGIDPNRLSAKGYGLTKPIASNNTPMGRSMNRRVEMIILEKQE